MGKSKKAVIYALVACVIWGTVYVAVKSGLDHGFAPLGFAGMRFLAGGLMLLAVARMRGPLRLTMRDMRQLSMLGFFQTGVQNALFFTGVKLTGAGVSAIFINTSTFFVILFAPMFFPDSRLTLRRMAGVMTGFAGVAVATGGGLYAPGYGLGVAALILSAMTWAGSNIAAKKIMEGRDTVTVTGMQMATGAVPLVVAGWFLEGGLSSGVDSTGWAIFAYLIVFATSIPFLAWYKALEMGEVGGVSIVAFTLPVFGVVSGCLLLGEPLGPHIFAGMLLVAAGIVIVNLRVTPPGRFS